MVSMWAKHKFRQQQSYLCNSNRDCGYIPIDDESIHRIGLRGRKKCLFYGLLGLLSLLTLLNILLNLLLFFAYKLYNPHHAFVDFWSHKDKISFNREVLITNALPSNNELLNIPGQELIVTANRNNEVFINSQFSNRSKRSLNTKNTKLRFDANQTIFEDTEQFAFILPSTHLNESIMADNVYFSGFVNDKSLPFLPDSIILNRVWTPKVSNYVNDFAYDENAFKMRIVSDGQFIKLRGNQGITFTTTDLNLNATQDINIMSKEGSILFTNTKGNIFIPTQYLPFQGFADGNIDASSDGKLLPSFKLCVCMPSGKLFSVPVLDKNTNCIVNGLAPRQNHPCKEEMD
ncbi:unnamed protein product [Gordionus sp. m RMFG-2023]|uniref:beta-sarcoglycan-like n=1 Tax=Gordionus sp. m RMFG-2023 TaxID=3053472 RepID=UPI0030E1DFB1